MTEADQIVDERQRLVADLELVRGWLAGDNRRDDGPYTSDAAVVARAIAALASRPQEQPRKATGAEPFIRTVERILDAESAWIARPDHDVTRRIAFAAIAAYQAELAAYPDLSTVPVAVSVSPAAVEGWQPIETAPKDGTLVDLWYPGGGRFPDCFWNEDRWFQSIGDGDSFSTNGNSRPSYWMRIPAAPPSPAAQEQK